MISYNPINTARIAYDSIKKSHYTRKLGLGLCSLLALTLLGCGKKGSKNGSDCGGLEICLSLNGLTPGKTVKANPGAIKILIDGEEGEIPTIEMDGVTYGVFKAGSELILMEDPTQFTVDGKKVNVTGKKPYKLNGINNPK